MTRNGLRGWTLVLAIALAAPGFVGFSAAQAKTAKGDESAAALSKEEQQKLKDHNKLRSEISKIKYPATKSEVVTRIKGVKADDKKWVGETLADKTYNSADEVVVALGWEVAPSAEKGAAAPKTEKSTEKTTEKTTGKTSAKY